MLLIGSGTRGLAPMRALLNWTPVQVSPIDHAFGQSHYCGYRRGQAFRLPNLGCYLAFDMLTLVGSNIRPTQHVTRLLAFTWPGGLSP